MPIEIRNLNKIYKNGHQALTDVNLTIDEGMFGLLGPNGAGKSSLMRILVTLADPSSGTVKVNGYDLKRNKGEIRTMLGYLPQDFRYFAKLKAWEFLDYSASLSGMKNRRARREAVDEQLRSVGLFDVRDRLANKLSGGMKRRLGIAQALIGDPRVVIVDEPTTGLDPDERIRFRNLLTNLSRKEVVIILSTHIVGDISSSCKDMALLNLGQVRYKGSPKGFLDLAKGSVWRMKVAYDDLDKVKNEMHVIATIPDEDCWLVEVVAEDLGNFKGEAIEPNLEHAYVYFTEFGMRDGVIAGV
ncbi:multidrug ABC transporter ATP-binding protein [Fulvitalea axinellae]|uniref:Multidrug ABC transporter ATP-binding protein n=1 Tax=Fulvitalea axinellae TaxID=1182444 RepID=A0AAU9DHS0_9BACT|nr:multidrug ABC transporter ATP-binding protein [Fulvitalea axinellae]